MRFPAGKLAIFLLVRLDGLPTAKLVVQFGCLRPVVVVLAGLDEPSPGAGSHRHQPIELERLEDQLRKEPTSRRNSETWRRECDANSRCYAY